LKVSHFTKLKNLTICNTFQVTSILIFLFCIVLATKLQDIFNRSAGFDIIIVIVNFIVKISLLAVVIIYRIIISK